MKGYILTDLIPLDTLQQVQDAFSEYTGLAASIIDTRGITVTSPSGFSNFCTNMIRKSPLGRARCEKCDKNGALLSLKNSSPAVYTCHSGLIDYSAPIMVDGEFLGAFVGGQIFPEEPDFALMETSAQDLGIDPEIYIQEARNTNLRTKEQVQKAAVFIQEIASVLSATALKNYKNHRKNQQMEQITRSQMLRTSELTTNLRESITSWNSLIQQALETDDVSKIHSHLESIMHKSAEIYTIVDDTLNFIQITNGKVELSENVYNIRDILESHIKLISGNKIFRRVELTYTVSNNLPKYLFGDSARICQLISKLYAFVALYTKKGTLNLFVGLENISYSKTLILQICDKSGSISNEKLTLIKNYLYYGSGDDFNPEELSISGLPVIKQAVKHLNGKLELNELEDNGVEFVISIPQLESPEGEL